MVIDIENYTLTYLDETLKGVCIDLHTPFAVGDCITNDELKDIKLIIDNRCKDYYLGNRTPHQRNIDAYRGELVEFCLRYKYPTLFTDARNIKNKHNDLLFNNTYIIECKAHLESTIDKNMNKWITTTSNNPKQLDYNYIFWFVREIEYVETLTTNPYYTNDLLKMTYYLKYVENNQYKTLWK